MTIQDAKKRANELLTELEDFTQLLLFVEYAVQQLQMKPDNARKFADRMVKNFPDAEKEPDEYLTCTDYYDEFMLWLFINPGELKAARGTALDSFLAEVTPPRVKMYLEGHAPANLSQFPNFHRTGNVAGMREKYYGKDALLVWCGDYIYNVSAEPSLYEKAL